MKNFSCLFLDIGGVLLSKGWGHEFRHKATEKFNDYPKGRSEEGNIEIDLLIKRNLINLLQDLCGSKFYQNESKN